MGSTALKLGDNPSCSNDMPSPGGAPPHAAEEGERLNLIEGATGDPSCQTDPYRHVDRLQRGELFMGREKEMDWILGELFPGCVTTLCGVSGIGKRTLVGETLHFHRDKIARRFPDGVIVHSFYNEPESDKCLERIVRFFGSGAQPASEEAARNALAGKRVLLFLDSIEDADNLEKVRSVVGTNGLLMTSRDAQEAGAGRLKVLVMKPDKAMELLQAWGGEAVIDPTVANKISMLLGGLPLAIRIAGHFLRSSGQSAAAYLAWLEETPLESMAHRERKFMNVPLLLEHSLDQLSDTAIEVLGIAGGLAFAPFSRKVMAAAMAVDSWSLEQPLDELVNTGLMVREDTRYMFCHAAVHQYASKIARPPRETLQQITAFYLEFCRFQLNRGNKGYGQLDGERCHIMKMLSTCLERELLAEASELAAAVNDYLEGRNRFIDLLFSLRVGFSAATATGDTTAERFFIGRLGNISRILGEEEDAVAYYKEAVKISREMGDRQGECRFLGNLGHALRAFGKINKAITYYEEALEVSQAMGDRQGQGQHLNHIGLSYRALGQNDKAIEYFEKALQITRILDDRNGESNQLGHLGNLFLASGNVAQAVTYYEQALQLARESGDRRCEGNHLGNLGNAHFNRGDMNKAVAHYKLALQIARDIGDRRGEGNRIGNLGLIYRSVGKMKKAVDHYKSALRISREVGDRRGECNHLGNLGNLCRAAGQTDRAVDYYEKALRIAREAGDRFAEGAILGNLGLAHRARAESDTARDCLEQALRIFKEIGSPQAKQVERWLRG